MEYTLSQEQIDSIDKILQEELLEGGVHSVILIDMAGNIISELNNGERKHDVYSLAALAAGNFGAVKSVTPIFILNTL